MRETYFVRTEFIEAIKEHQAAYALELDQPSIELLSDHYDLVQRHNPNLHLVAPCSAEEFAQRHTLESLTLIGHLPPHAVFTDVGPGGGFPSLPCLIARNDLSADLIEAKEKKARFLASAAKSLGLEERVEVIARQFQELRDRKYPIITCRALEKFGERLPYLLKRFSPELMFLFGGPVLADRLAEMSLRFESRLLPLSRERFLFIVRT